MSVLGVKRKSKRKKILIVIIVSLILLVIWVIPSIIISKKDPFTVEKAVKDNNKRDAIISLLRYNISDLYKVHLVEEEQKNYILNIDNNIVYSNILPINIKIENYSADANYKVDILLNENLVMQKNISSAEEKIELQLEREGRQTLQVDFYRNDEKTNSETVDIYYIEPYKEQFLDELSNNSVTAHYRALNYEDYDKSSPLLTKLGVNAIRMEFFCSWMYSDVNNTYNFSSYDKWIKDLKEKDPEIKIIAIIQPVYRNLGSDDKFSSEEEVDFYVETCKAIANHYPEIEYFEILNEPNHIYITDEDLYWYRMVIEKSARALKEINPNIKIISGACSAGTVDTDTYLSSKTFFDKMYSDEVYELSETFAYNVYTSILEKIETHKNQFNDFGGFLKQYITEYGVSTYNGTTEEEQAIRLVKQTNWLKKYGVYYSNIYNFWDTKADTETQTHNYGLLHNDYTPKPSYYAMKNYYENTNGAEYIGTINLNKDLEAYVYDKDGKVKIITLTKNIGDSVNIPYDNFTASDIYGNEIENIDGTLTITNSAVYMDNASTKYFYEAISNTALEKYTEFEEKFAQEIGKVEGLQGKIDELKQYMQSISTVNSVTETVAKQKMEEHFNLGNLILEAYKNESLDIEYVKLSSMLDMLNDIGDSFEDLVTVSSKTRDPNLTETKTLIDTVELDLKNNSDIEIIYPNKILEFSKDLYEESEYINSLSKENDIKTGLIVSKDLHAKYLANWAQIFTNLYIDEYIENNPVTISYSETNLTNKDVVATINANDIKVTNNEGKNAYTFTENGTFTFEYIRRGKNQKVESKVNNIDKKAPEISNLKDRQILFESIVPNISDKNLDTITLKKDGQVITYNHGDTIQDNGLYELIVKDKATNEISIKFRIADEPTYNYTIKDSYISSVKAETTQEEFKKNYITIDEYNILHNDTELENSDVVSTGDIVQFSDGTTYTIIVAGDISKDGKVTAYDLSMLRNYILRIEELDNIEMLAADANCDGKNVGASDYSRIREIILGIK